MQKRLWLFGDNPRGIREFHFSHEPFMTDQARFYFDTASLRGRGPDSLSIAKSYSCYAWWKPQNQGRYSPVFWAGVLKPIFRLEPQPCNPVHYLITRGRGLLALNYRLKKIKLAKGLTMARVLVVKIHKFVTV